MKKILPMILSVILLTTTISYTAWLTVFKGETVSTVDQITEESCQLVGKKFVDHPPAAPHCVDVYGDGGKPCNTTTECNSGQCVTRDDYDPGDTQKVGYCKFDGDSICFSSEVEVVDGKRQDRSFCTNMTDL